MQENSFMFGLKPCTQDSIWLFWPIKTEMTCWKFATWLNKVFKNQKNLLTGLTLKAN